MIFFFFLYIFLHFFFHIYLLFLYFPFSIFLYFLFFIYIFYQGFFYLTTPPPLYTILKLRMSYILVISLQFPPPLVHSISPHSNLFIFLFDIQFKQENQAYLFTIAEISLDYGLYSDTGCLRKVLSLWDLYSVPGCLRNISR